MPTMLDPTRAKEIVRRLFADRGHARYGPIEIIQDPVERIPGMLFVALGEHGDQGAVTIQLFGGLGALGGQLWGREVDALTRASRRDHVSLPNILHGGYDDTDDVGFVVTKSTGSLLGNDVGPFLANQRWSLRCLALLVDALRHIHACGIVHRNLSPETLAWAQHPTLPDVEFVALCRFEFSALLANLLRLEGAQDANGLRTLLAAQTPGSLACMAPERLAAIFPDTPWEPDEDPRIDIFSLGVVALQWFTGPLPEDALAAAFPGGRVDPNARVTLQRRIEEPISEGGRLPRELRRLLRGMLAWDVRNRLTSAEVASDLSRDFELIERALGSQGNKEDVFTVPGRNWIISGTAQEFADLKKWGWLSNDPSLDLEGLRTFLESDLQGGVLVFEPRGFEPYDIGRNRTGVMATKMRRAQWVLLGKLGAYFCSLWEAGPRSVKLPWSLHIRYTLKREYESARDLEERLFQRRLPALRFVGHTSALLRDIPENRDHYPSWGPLLESVQAEPARPEWYGNWRDATNFLLEWQAAELELRRYPYRLTTTSPDRGDVTLEYDWKRDEDRRDNFPSPLVRLLLRDMGWRPNFVAFFDTLEERDGSGRVTWHEEGESWKARRPVEGAVGYVLDPDLGDTIRVRVPDGSPPVPRNGWLEPEADRGSRTLLARQREARTRLLKHPALLDQLNRPRSAVTLRRDWAEAAAATLDPTSRAAKIVPRILRAQPFFALQGPPGSGKSTVTSLVTAAMLRAESGNRILVSAQSHAALDELAQKIVARLRREAFDVQAIRIAASEQDVKPKVREFLLKRQAEARVRRIERSAEEMHADPNLSPTVRALLGRWREDVPRALPEIEDRLRRGANLVFATCGTATTERLGVQSEYDLFDYVFVEEAAKAWPTEVMMPLVLGMRWVLVGDHKQLSAYRRDDASQILTACESAADPSLREHGARREQYEAVFDFFERFFTEGPTDAVDFLDVQFRMREPISEVVSKAFYAGALRTSPSTEIDHGLRKPAVVAGRALVWLNTHGLVGYEEKRRWKNEGEARLLRSLLAAFGDDVLAFPVEDDESPLAILSPYRQQNKLLEGTLPHEFHRFIHTVDSFQGGQAHVVLVSLVRTNPFSADEDPLKAIGHLAREDRVNVMLSRARRLEVIVGDFEHFARSTTPFWPQICATVAEKGYVIPANVLEEVGG